MQTGMDSFDSFEAQFNELSPKIVKQFAQLLEDINGHLKAADIVEQMTKISLHKFTKITWRCILLAGRSPFCLFDI